MVSIGSTMRKGVDEAAFLVVRSPIRTICETISANMMRKWTSGQNAAPLSYS